mgnify:CR=1 FL=1
MTDEAERLLGEIDGRTKGILTAVGDIKSNINDLFIKVNSQQSTLDKLGAEHRARTKQGVDCNQTVNTPTISKMLMAYMGGSGVVGAGLVLIILLLLKKWGLL